MTISEKSRQLYELMVRKGYPEDFAALIGAPVYADGAYGFEAKSPTTCWTEDFGYVRAGVPAIVASHAEPESIYHGPAYHSTMDNVILGVDEAAWAKSIELFKQYALSLDALATRPMNFSNRFKVMAESYEGDADIDGYLTAAAALDEKIASIKEKLFLLPDDTKVLPGHMGATTIGVEKRYNPFV